MKQRIGLSKALEQPELRQGEERAMASVFWATSRHRGPGRVRVLAADDSRAVHGPKRVSH